MKATIFLSPMPMKRSTVATMPPTTNMETLPAPVSAPGISMITASRKKSTHLEL